MARRRFTTEFKLEAVQLIRDRGGLTGRNSYQTRDEAEAYVFDLLQR
jgi:transposase-like protein